MPSNTMAPQSTNGDITRCLASYFSSAIGSCLMNVPFSMDGFVTARECLSWPTFMPKQTYTATASTASDLTMQQTLLRSHCPALPAKAICPSVHSLNDTLAALLLTQVYISHTMSYTHTVPLFFHFSCFVSSPHVELREVRLHLLCPVP